MTSSGLAIETDATILRRQVGELWPAHRLTEAQAHGIRSRYRDHAVEDIGAALRAHYEAEPQRRRPKWPDVERLLKRIAAAKRGPIQAGVEAEVAAIQRELATYYGTKPAWWLRQTPGYVRPTWHEEMASVGATLADWRNWRDCAFDVPVLEQRCRGDWPTEAEEAGGYREVDDPEHAGQRLRVADFRMKRAARERLIQRLDVRVRNLRTFGPVTVAQKALWRGSIEAAARGGPPDLLVDELAGVSPF